jgi:hypothetical protein
MHAAASTPGHRALTASGLSLAAALGAVAMFLPPLLQDTIASPLRAALAGAALGCSLLLHGIFLGIAAGRLQRSRIGWLGFSLLLFPLGSVTALVLLGWGRSADGAGRPRRSALALRQVKAGATAFGASAR